MNKAVFKNNTLSHTGNNPDFVQGYDRMAREAVTLCEKKDGFYLTYSRIVLKTNRNTIHIKFIPNYSIYHKSDNC